MSNVYFIGDLHFGHKAVLKFSPIHRAYQDIDEHDAKLIDLWNKRVNKRDIVYMVGDICWGVEHLPKIGLLNGKKILVRGNHDYHTNARDWLEYVDDVHGITVYKGHWVSHCPIHPDELWHKKNIHGHVHMNSVKNPDGTLDRRYINVSVEAVGGTPVSFQDIVNGWYDQNRKC